MKRLCFKEEYYKKDGNESGLIYKRGFASFEWNYLTKKLALYSLFSHYYNTY